MPQTRVNVFFVRGTVYLVLLAAGQARNGVAEAVVAEVAVELGVEELKRLVSQQVEMMMRRKGTSRTLS